MSKLTDEQKIEISLEMLCSKLTHSEVWRKHGISASYAYEIRHRALEILRAGIGRSARQVKSQFSGFVKRVQDLEQLTVDQAMAIRILKANLKSGRRGRKKAGKVAK